MNWTDILVLIIIGGNMLYGFSRGFITTVIGLVKWFASIFIAKMFYVEFTDYITTNWYNPNPVIQGHVEQFIMNVLKIDASVDAPMTSEQIQMGIEQLKLPELYSRGLSNLQGGVTYASFINDLATQITHMVVYAIGFLVLMILVMMALGIVESIANSLAKLPILKEFNKSGGLLLGGILGLISVYFFMIILNILAPFEWSQQIVLAIEQSQFAIYFYKYNILQYFFVSFFSSLYKSFLMM